MRRRAGETGSSHQSAPEQCGIMSEVGGTEERRFCTLAPAASAGICLPAGTFLVLHRCLHDIRGRVGVGDVGIPTQGL